MPRDKAQTSMRTAAAIEMRMLGWTYDEIATELGYASKSGAYNAVKRALVSRVHKDVDLYRADALVRLERMQALVWPRVMQGDPKAIDVVRKLLKQRLLVLGYDPHQPKPTQELEQSQQEEYEHFHML